MEPPAHGRADRYFNRMREALFEDHGFLLLYIPTPLDGIDVDIDGIQAEEITGLLADTRLRDVDGVVPVPHPSRWFEPFR